MRSTVYREVSSVRRTSQPRLSRRESVPSGGFGQLLAKLGLASERLEQSRPRRRRS